MQPLPLDELQVKEQGGLAAQPRLQRCKTPLGSAALWANLIPRDVFIALYAAAPRLGWPQSAPPIPAEAQRLICSPPLHQSRRADRVTEPRDAPGLRWADARTVPIPDAGEGLPLSSRPGFTQTHVHSRRG